MINCVINDADGALAHLLRNMFDEILAVEVSDDGNIKN